MAQGQADLSKSPIQRIDGDPACGLLILCDHASNAMPAEYECLGLPARDLERHIAYDIGAAEVTRALAGALGAPALLACFSRLLIDPNRGLDDPTLVMRLSDGALAPGNARIGEAEIARRIERFYRPYDLAIAQAVEAALAGGAPPALLSIHSFTPVWKASPRPWHASILWDCDPRLPDPLIGALRREGDLIIGANEPYDGALEGDTLYRHATLSGLANALVEIRQDLIAQADPAREWGLRLARILKPILADRELRRVQLYPSRAQSRIRARAHGA